MDQFIKDSLTWPYNPTTTPVPLMPYVGGNTVTSSWSQAYDYNLKIRKVSNGWIVNSGYEDHVFTTIESLTTFISQKLENK